MYKTFYKLKRNPFEITPDPLFLFPTIRHNEALASLYYGVTSHRGFVVLTGEVGTGKTLILRSLLELLQRFLSLEGGRGRGETLCPGVLCGFCAGPPGSFFFFF